MNSFIARTLLVVITGFFLLAPMRSHGIGQAVSELERALANLKGNTNLAEIEQAIKRAEQTIEEGRRFTNQMAAQITLLEKDKVELARSKENLETARLIFGTGFVGALLGAMVAFLQKRNSKAERALKELEVVEKIAKLKAAQIGVPREIEEKYVSKM